VACLSTGGWMKETMVSRGVKISIAEGVAETEDGNYCESLFFFFFFFFKSYFNCLYGTRNDMHV